MRSCSARCDRLRGGILLATALAPGITWAHSPVPGFRGFYVGLLHPLITPAQLLALLATGLLLGLRRRQGLGTSLLLFALASAAGIAAGQVAGYPGWIDLTLALLAACAAVLAALRPTGRVLPAGAVEVPAGLLLGLASTPESGPALATAITLAGSLVGLALALAWITALTLTAWTRFTWPWARLSLRIASAWLAAVSVLMAALLLAADQP